MATVDVDELIVGADDDVKVADTFRDDIEVSSRDEEFTWNALLGVSNRDEETERTNAEIGSRREVSLSERSSDPRGEVDVDEEEESGEDEDVVDEREFVSDVISTLRSISGEDFFGIVREATFRDVKSLSAWLLPDTRGWYVAASGWLSLFSSSPFISLGDADFGAFCSTFDAVTLNGIVGRGRR